MKVGTLTRSQLPPRETDPELTKFLASVFLNRPPEKKK